MTRAIVVLTLFCFLACVGAVFHYLIAPHRWVTTPLFVPEAPDDGDPDAGAADDLRADLAPAAPPRAEPGILPAGDALASTIDSVLQEGQRALAEGQITHAIRLCLRAADVHDRDRGAALVCAGRGYYLLGPGWYERARALALQAEDQPLHPQEAHLLLGDALRQLKDCRDARTAYLEFLDEQPEKRGAACDGLRACQGDPKPGTCGVPLPKPTARPVS